MRSALHWLMLAAAALFAAAATIAAITIATLLIIILRLAEIGASANVQ